MSLTNYFKSFKKKAESGYYGKVIGKNVRKATVSIKEQVKKDYRRTPSFARPKAEMFFSPFMNKKITTNKKRKKRRKK